MWFVDRAVRLSVKIEFNPIGDLAVSWIQQLRILKAGAPQSSRQRITIVHPEVRLATATKSPHSQSIIITTQQQMNQRLTAEPRAPQTPVKASQHSTQT